MAAWGPDQHASDGSDLMKSREVIKAIEAEGWYLIRSVGSHHQFRHPDRPGLVTVPHPNADLAIGTLKSIERQSGVSLRRS
jgi:predicted RNA binding protein YcfA (HicA-like mRNA interferase family)